MRNQFSGLSVKHREKERKKERKKEEDEEEEEEEEEKREKGGVASLLVTLRAKLINSIVSLLSLSVFRHFLLAFSATNMPLISCFNNKYI